MFMKTGIPYCSWPFSDLHAMKLKIKDFIKNYHSYDPEKIELLCFLDNWVSESAAGEK